MAFLANLPALFSDKDDLATILKPYNYKYAGRLGEGSYGSVHLARSMPENTRAPPNQWVAVKEIITPPRYSAVDVLPADREYDVLSYLKSVNGGQCPTNILCIYDKIRVPGGTVLVTEYFNPTTTDREFGSLPYVDQLELMYKMALAISYLHTLGVAHRDIKPDNILIDGTKMDIRIIDFGFACMAPELAPLGRLDSKACALAEPMGTPYFMAPELLWNGSAKVSPQLSIDKKALKAADVWALGVTFYVLLIYTYPFNANTRTDLIRLLVGTEPDMPDSIPMDMVTLLDGMLNKDVDKRLTMAQVVDYLASILEDEGVASTSASTSASTHASTHTSTRRR